MLAYILDLCGVAVFAISGVLVAGRKQMDVFGVIVIAMVTAIGGGTIRDLLVKRPIFWFQNTTYIYVIIAACLLTMLYTKFLRPPHRILLIMDALGLALFTMSGAHIAEQARLPALIVVMLASITAAAGGMVRDVLCNEIPLVLQKDIYMTAALAGATVYVLLERIQLNNLLVTLLGMVVVFALRMAAIFWHLHLPRYHFQEKA